MSDKKRKRKHKAIVVDYDDTVVDFMGFLCHLYNVKNGTCISPNDLKEWDFKDVEVKDARGNVVKGEKLRKMFKDYENQGLYAALPIIEESRRALDMAAKLGYKIIILTARDGQFKAQTEINLIRNNIPYNELIFDWDKVKIINDLKKSYKIAFFADDKFDTVKKVADSCDLDYNFLVEKAHNRDIDLSEEDETILRIRDLFETVRYLK